MKFVKVKVTRQRNLIYTLQQQTNKQIHLIYSTVKQNVYCRQTNLRLHNARFYNQMILLIGEGVVAFLQLPQMIDEKLILLYFVRSKPFSDWKSSENSQKARDFSKFISHWNFFRLIFTIIIAHSIGNFIMENFITGQFW